MGLEIVKETVILVKFAIQMAYALTYVPKSPLEVPQEMVTEV